MNTNMDAYDFYKALRKAGVMPEVAGVLPAQIVGRPIHNLKAHQVLMDYFVWTNLPPPDNDGLSWVKVFHRMQLLDFGMPMDITEPVPAPKKKNVLSINLHQ